MRPALCRKGGLAADVDDAIAKFLDGGEDGEDAELKGRAAGRKENSSFSCFA